MSGNNQGLIDDCKNELKSIESYVLANPLESICSYLISYCVIRGCGTIEKVLKNIIFEHLTFNANSEAKKYFEKNILESSWNPSSGKIQQILDVINPVWSNQFQTQINGTKEKGDLSSLINLRNDFAHGQLITTTVTDVISYFDGAIVILNILCGIVV